MNAPLPLDWLCCPLSGQPLREAEAGLIARLEAARREGRLRFVKAPGVAQIDLSLPLEAGLIREDGAVFYLTAGEVPVLLPDHALAVE